MNRLQQHIKAKHEEIIIPCEECDFEGLPEVFVEHMRRNHKKECGNKNKTEDKGKRSTNKNVKSKNGNVTIPCDLCSFVGKTASDYMKHIENHNKDKTSISLPCDMCDYVAKSVDTFKLHIETAHGIKVKKYDSFRHKSKCAK